MPQNQTARRLRLTPRWQPLRFHPVQSRAWNHPARFKTVHAGRRSGKTEIFGKRKRVLWLWDCLVNRRPWPNPRSFIAAPTRDQVKSIYWSDVKLLTPSKWISRISETELSIVTKWNAELRLVGLDKPSRMEGQPWDAGAIDELADCKAGIWGANIRPAIADRNGTVDLLGVPDMNGPSQAEYRDFCKLGRGGDPEWADFSWGSDGILPASEIDSMRRSMDPRLFLQETTGEFILSGGRAFPDFDDSPGKNVRADVEYTPLLPLCWSLDFNIDPNCSVVGQHHAGEVRLFDELALPDTRTEVVCDKFLERAEKQGWKLDDLCVYGDPAGNQRKSSATRTDWQIVRNALRHVPGVRFKVSSAHSLIKDTVSAVNARILAADGQRRLIVHPRCKRIIADFAQALAGTEMDEQHCVAAVRYFVHREYPIKSTIVVPDEGADVL